MIRDRVEELWPQAVGEPLLQFFDVKTVLVEGDRDEFRLEAAERLDRAEVGRSLDDDHVCRIEECFPDELERLDSAARDQQFVLRGPTALTALETIGQRVQRARDAARRRVLEGGGLAGCRELLQERGDSLTRERLRIGETTRERNDIGSAEQREHRGNAVAEFPACPSGGESLPASRVERERHP